jgi:hypothetical protein
MKFSTRLKKLGICVSQAKKYELFDDFETYLFDGFRLAMFIEGDKLIISKLNLSSFSDWEEIYVGKNYSKKSLKIKPID